MIDKGDCRVIGWIGALLWAALLAHPAYAQVPVQHQPPTVIERGKVLELEFQAAGLGPDRFSEAGLYYRYDGEASYRRQKAEYRNGAFRVGLQINDSSADAFEYYFRAELNDGSLLRYPAFDPAGEPVRVELVQPRRQEVPDTVSAGGMEYTILSPEPDRRVSRRNTVIAITFFYDEKNMEPGEFLLFLDGRDVSGDAKRSDFFLSYVPGDLADGLHQVRVVYKSGSGLREIADWNFTVGEDRRRSISTVAGAPQSTPASGPTLGGRVELSALNQQLAGQGNDALRGDFDVSGRYGMVRYRFNGLLTSQESSRLQPQNRYGAEIHVGKWADLNAGHIYPYVSRLTLAGRRLQGVDAQVHLARENINLQFLYGRLNREVTNLYEPIVATYDTVAVTPADGPVIDSTYALHFGEQGRGTYRRKLVGGRLAFGNGRHVRFGLHALKIQDDTTSIQTINDFRDVLLYQSDIAGGLSPADRAWLQQNPGALNVDGASPKPKGNFTAGSDLLVNLDKGRIRLEAEAAASLLNENINGGYLTRQRADDLGIELDSDTQNLLSRLSWLIIINEQMSTLPLRYKSTVDSTTSLEPFVPMGIFAGQSRLGLHYFDHNLQVRYRWIGPDYSTLANSTVRRDIAGVTLSDRYSLLDNQLYLSLEYENLKDNLTGTSEATTTTQTLRSGMSWYPLDRGMPRVSISLRYQSRANGVDRRNTYLDGDLLQAALYNTMTGSADAVSLLPAPVSARTWQYTGSVSQQVEWMGAAHDLSLSGSLMRTFDHAFSYGDLKSSAWSLALQNRFDTMPLTTRFSFNYNHTESNSGLSKYDIIGFNIGGSLYLMDETLNLFADLAFTRNTSRSVSLQVDDNGTPDLRLDDFYYPGTGGSHQSSNAYILQGGMRYNLTRHHVLEFNLGLTSISARQGIYAAPNDYRMQARYIYRF